MKQIPLALIALLATLSFTACHADDTSSPTASPQAASKADENSEFLTTAKGVTKVLLVILPGPTGGEALNKKIADLGGFPDSADTTTSKKAVDSQYAIGYAKGGKPVVAVVVDKDGKETVITDPDIAGGYSKKARSLEKGKEAEEESVSTSGGSGGGNGGPGGGGSTGEGKAAPGAPIHIGDTRASVEKKFGHPDESIEMPDGTITCAYHNIDPEAVGRSYAVNAVSGAMGMFGGIGSVVGHKAADKKTSSYNVKYRNGIVISVSKSNSNG